MTGPRHLDFEPEEQKRQQSLSARGRHVRRRRHDRITLVDTPGYADFVAEVDLRHRRRRRRASRRGRARAASRPARGGRRPRPIVGPGGRLLHQQVRPRERRPDARPSMRSGPRSAPRSRRSTWPSGPAETFSGYVDLVHRKAFAVGRQAGSRDRRSRPSSKPRSPRRRDQLLEAAAEADDDVLTKYLEGEEISDAELEACLRKGVTRVDPRARSSSAAPPRASASRRCSTRSSAICPSPAEEPPVDAREREVRRRGPRSSPTRAGRSLARVFKTAADPFVGRLTYFRVFSGTLHGQAHAWNANRERGRADRPAPAAPRQGPGAGRRAQGGRDRRRRQARRDRDRRHAHRRREKPLVLPPTRRSPSRRCRSRSSPRRRPTSTRWARPSSGCSRRSRAARVERCPDRRAAPGRARARPTSR